MTRIEEKKQYEGQGEDWEEYQKAMEKHGEGRAEGLCTGMKQGAIRMDWLRPGWYYFGREPTS